MHYLGLQAYDPQLAILSVRAIFSWKCDELFHISFRWVTTKLVPRKSQLNETLHFLLDHPRRCFIYLFPSHQTWFLLTMLIILK